VDNVIAGYLQVANSGEQQQHHFATAKLFAGNETGLAGIGELQYVLEQTQNISGTNQIIVDPTWPGG
jgi:hypothetical protein